MAKILTFGWSGDPIGYPLFRKSPKFPTTRLLIPKFRLVDSQSHDLLKQTATAEGDYLLLYYRDHDQFEVDLIVENAGGQLVGVEIKSAASVTTGDLRCWPAWPEISSRWE